VTAPPVTAPSTSRQQPIDVRVFNENILPLALLHFVSAKVSFMLSLLSFQVHVIVDSPAAAPAGRPPRAAAQVNIPGFCC